MRRNKGPRRVVPLAVGCVAALAFAAGCAGPSATGQASGAAATKKGQRVVVDARSVPGVGTVLVTSDGYALYMFSADDQKRVTCTGVCAGTWPPLAIAWGTALVAGPGVKQSLLSSVPDPAGGRVVTYGGWPLYTYAADVEPDQANGQDLDLNGGYWYVISPSGQPLETP